MMIDFKSSFSNCLSPDEILKLTYHDLLKEEHDICILINQKVFFEQPLFPILEFLFSYLTWRKKLNSKCHFFSKLPDFFYNSIETEDNPLLSFTKMDNGWQIDSPWKTFDCKEVFQLNDFVDACDKLI